MTRMLGRTIRITIGERRFHDSLRVAFSVEKTLGSAAHMGRGQLDVWNLNPDSRAQLDKPGTQVVVEAGYGKDLSVLFATSGARGPEHAATVRTSATPANRRITRR